MTINFCEVCLATILCTIITIILYIASWYNHEEEEEEKPKKEADTSNIQGLENDQATPRGEPNEIINYDSNRTDEQQSSGEIVKEKSDLCRLQDEDFRARVAESDSSDEHLSEGYVHIDDQTTLGEYDAVVHPENKIGRLHLSIRYDDERSQLIVRIIDAEGVIRPEQVYAPEMVMTAALIGLDGNEMDGEKHSRVFVDNASVNWKKPMTFCVTYENAQKQHLYFNLSNKTDPAAPRDRELSIPLADLGDQNEEINQWFDLQLIQASN